MKQVKIKATNITPKQWSTLLLELNLMVKAWKPFANLTLETKGLQKVIAWGTRKGKDAE
jgi:hypothetical protein